MYVKLLILNIYLNWCIDFFKLLFGMLTLFSFFIVLHILKILKNNYQKGLNSLNPTQMNFIKTYAHVWVRPNLEKSVDWVWYKNIGRYP